MTTIEQPEGTLTLQTLSIRTFLEVPEYEVIPQAFRELMGHLKKHQYQTPYPSFFACYTEKRDKEMLVEMCIPVSGEAVVDARLNTMIANGDDDMVRIVARASARLRTRSPRFV